MRASQGLVFAGCLLLLGCTGAPVDAAGSWSVNLTNGANPCMLDSWTVGATASGVPLTITQTGASAQAVVGGVPGAGVAVLFGSATLTGSVSGDRIDLHLAGRAASRGSCAYTPTLDLVGTVRGDTLEGSVIWAADTNSSADCAELATCENLQALNGARPPRR